MRSFLAPLVLAAALGASGCAPASPPTVAPLMAKAPAQQASVPHKQAPAPDQQAPALDKQPPASAPQATPASPAMASATMTTTTKGIATGPVPATEIAVPAIFLSRYGPVYPAASDAATISKQSEEALRRSGWIDIGSLEVSAPLLDCRSPAPCKPISGEDVNSLLRREAGLMGGEQVTLFRDRKQVNQAVCDPAFANACSVVGTRVLEQSGGVVWRRVPELAPLRLLVYAAAHGDLATVNLLLAQSTDPDTIEPRLGMAPLHFAAQEGHAEVVAALLRHHAQIELVDRAGTTPLGYAAFITSPTPARCLAANVLRRAGAKEPPTPIHGNPIDFPPPARCPR
jgi:Ankyrin repeats (3 copies)